MIIGYLAAVEYYIGGVAVRDLPSSPDRLDALLHDTRTIGNHPEAEAVTLIVHADDTIWPVQCDIEGCDAPDIRLCEGDILACGSCRTARGLTEVPLPEDTK